MQNSNKPYARLLRLYRPLAANKEKLKMEIKNYCDRIIELYEEVSPENQDRSLAIQLIYKMRFEIDKTTFTNDSLIPILITTNKIASTKKNLKQILEKELLSLISYLPHKLWMENDGEKRNVFQRGIGKKEGQIAESLINFAKEIFEIKLDRDAFAGKRRGYSIQILESLSNYFEVPEFMELCSKSIKSKSKNEFLDSIECLKEYCKEKDEIPSEELIEIINKRIEKTKHRTEAVGGLNLQVEIGLIDELEALLRLDEWKEKNGRW